METSRWPTKISQLWRPTVEWGQCMALYCLVNLVSYVNTPLCIHRTARKQQHVLSTSEYIYLLCFACSRVSSNTAVGVCQWLQGLKRWKTRTN